ncbi:glycosyltransferase [Aurantibacillus circumpalustris]|uniref:glycosyltransferase n=1 Tax=Aurantibacillus circumpalustris TaxID=3036359 RepID=UPI00295B6AC0|nr:glycosyltransferase [Aurantibacillus circumpalustris]
MIDEQKSIISIIIPAYNYGNYLGECLDSVLAQTYSNWECVIVDNGSTDNTAQVAKSYVAKDPRFIYVHTEQKGVSFARNKAIELSKGKFILPLDADDKIASTYLEKAEKILRTKKDIRVVYCDAELFGASTGKWILPTFTLKGLLMENSIFCSALFRKSDFNTVGGYNIEMKEGFEDWDFWIRMLKTGESVYKIPEILFYYRIKPASRNSVLDQEKQLVLRRRIYINHKDVYDKMFDLSELIFNYHSVAKKLKSMEESTTYRCARVLLKPILFLRNIFKR